MFYLGFISQGGFGCCNNGLCGLVAIMASSVSLSIPRVGDNGGLLGRVTKSRWLGTGRPTFAARSGRKQAVKTSDTIMALIITGVPQHMCHLLSWQPNLYLNNETT